MTFDAIATLLRDELTSPYIIRQCEHSFSHKTRSIVTQAADRASWFGVNRIRRPSADTTLTLMCIRDLLFVDVQLPLSQFVFLTVNHLSLLLLGTFQRLFVLLH